MPGLVADKNEEGEQDTTNKMEDVDWSSNLN
jgi:hypothetical protein